VAAILSLAIGIGAKHGHFQHYQRVCFCVPLPYKDADRLVIMWKHLAGPGPSRGTGFPARSIFDIRNNHHGLGAGWRLAIGGNYKPYRRRRA